MTTPDETSRAPSVSWRSQPKPAAKTVAAAKPKPKTEYVLAVHASTVRVDEPACQVGLDILTAATGFHNWVTGLAKQLDDELAANKADLELQVDACYLIRKAREHLEDARKMLGRIESNLVNQVGYTWVLRMSAEPIRGQFATGSPDVKDVPKLPSASKDPEGYAECLQAVGVPPDAIDAGLLQFHFKGLGEFVARLAAEGKSPPKVFSRLGSYPEYTLTLRGRGDSPLNS